MTLVALRQCVGPQHATLSSAPVNILEDVILTRSAAKRIADLRTDEDGPQRLRLGVDGGGCSGFQYSFTTESKTTPLGSGDLVFERDGEELVVDDASIEFVKGSTVDFQEEMIRSAFVVTNNPQSESACGCGSSFALKNFSDNPALD